MSMEKNAMIGPDTPDLEPERPPAGQKQAAHRPVRTAEELDAQDPLKREAEAVKARLKDEEGRDRL
jgi:hypothetical protein